MRSFKHATGWVAVCCTLVGGYEGLSTTAYPDNLAHGLPTVCYGETEGVKLGDHYTKEQCADMLAEKLPRYWRDSAKCVPGIQLSDNEKIAYTSFSYNVGNGAFCKGIAPILRKGHHEAACNRMLAYDHASGRKVRGLTRRRDAEVKLCLTPDKAPATDVAIVTPEPDAPPVVIAAPPKPPAPVYPWYIRLWHWLIGAS